ncbi:ABC transporter permease [Glycomyces sp. L485]|uniref:ABC transporter permease n=1 Tax=Glycomyces sp. L485 TaxID=2909235 RepID=UPI001F4B9F65|nr:ABC transporter permease [Glycomyces sp. L485]MCH7232402.1 ABC transporter permease [Glycomyces sp. L485]
MTTATLDAPAEVAGRPGPGATLSQIMSMAWRQMVRIKHNPFELVDLSLSPVMFLLLFVYVFGGQMAGSTSVYLQYVLGGLIAQNAIFLTMYTGTGINADLRKGVYDRFRSLPIARSAPLAGKIFADMFKQVWSIAIMLVLGLLMGFELRSLSGAVFATLVLVMFALAISWFSVLAGVLADSEEKVQIYAFVVIMPLTFTSDAFVRVETLPGPLEAWAEVNPVSHLARTMRGLLSEGPVAEPLLWTSVWAVALLAVTAPLAMRAYKKKMI